MRPDALIFDLDGTLIDSAADLAVTLNLLLSEHQRPAVTLEAVRTMIGDGVGRLVQRGFAATGTPAAAKDQPALTRRFLELYTDPTRDHVARPYPGVLETLLQFAAQGLPMGVCTNKAQVATEMVLHEAGLSRFFRCVVGHDRAPAPKPDPSHVGAVYSALGHPGSAIMIGDSRNDLLAGRGFGLKVVLVTYGYGSPEALAAADATIDRFDDLPSVFAALD
jgi:phosphoglycolate phosphatase